MQSDVQSEIMRAMQDPGFYPHPVKVIKLQETHISRVLLTGDLVYKIKKPVNLGFLDFTSLEKRRHFCRLEVELNRRLTRGKHRKSTFPERPARTGKINGRKFSAG